MADPKSTPSTTEAAEQEKILKALSAALDDVNEKKKESDYLDQKILENLEKSKQLVDKWNDATEKHNQLALKQYELMEEQKLLREFSSDLTQEELAQLVEITLELEKQKEILFEMKKAMGEKFTEDFFPDISKNSKNFKSFMGDSSKKLQNFGNLLQTFGGKTGKLGEGISQVGQKIGKFTTGLGAGQLAVVGLLMETAKFAYQLDNLSKKIGSATGMGDEFNDVILDGYNATAMAGVSMEEYANSITNLASSYSAFDPSNNKMIRSLADTSTKLEKLGVNASTSSKMMDHFTRAQGMTAQQAADTTAQIALMGKAIGVTATKMAQDFESASGRLAIYGDKNIKVFKQLEAQAKSTGMEVSTLLSISQKFDTFDSAAGSIGQLNAVLGTNLSTLEMMNANDAERVQMMKDQIKMSVGSFDSLDKFTKMYVQQAMGVKDVAEAQRLLNMSNAEAQKYQKQQQEQADIQKELAERTAELVPLMDQLKIIGMKLFMVLSPIIQVFSGLIKFIGDVISWIGQLIPSIEMANDFLSVLKAILGGVAVGFLLATLPISGTAAAIMGLVGIFAALYDVLHWSGSPELWEMPLHVADGFGALGDVVGNVAKKIMNFVSNPLGSLWDAFHWSGSPALWEMPGVFADQIVRIADAITGTINAVTGFADTLIKMASIDYKGFVAIRTDGASTSMIMGSEDVVTSLNKGKLTVDVKMPEIKLPEVQVKVYIGNKELKEIIRTEVTSIVGKAG